MHLQPSDIRPNAAAAIVMYALSAALLDTALVWCDPSGTAICCLTSPESCERTWTPVSVALCGESAMMVGVRSQETERQRRQGKLTCISCPPHGGHRHRHQTMIDPAARVAGTTNDKPHLKQSDHPRKGAQANRMRTCVMLALHSPLCGPAAARLDRCVKVSLAFALASARSPVT